VLTAVHRTDNVQSTDATRFAAPSAGTFLISYDAAGDDLSLGLDGQPPAYVLADTVRGVWSADDLLVSFGARGSGFTTTSGQATLDDFVVRPHDRARAGSGAAAVCAAGAAALAGRRSGRQRHDNARARLGPPT
jgi:hypothetical protein